MVGQRLFEIVERGESVNVCRRPGDGNCLIEALLVGTTGKFDANAALRVRQYLGENLEGAGALRMFGELAKTELAKSFKDFSEYLNYSRKWVITPSAFLGRTEAAELAILFGLRRVFVCCLFVFFEFIYITLSC